MKDLEPIAFRLLLDRIVEPAKRNLRFVLLPIAVPLAITGVLTALVQVGWAETMMGNEFDLILPMMVGFFALIILIFVVYAAGFGALTIASFDALAGRTISMGRAWLKALRPRILGTMVITSIAVMISFMMCFLPALLVVPRLTMVLPVMIAEECYGWSAIQRSRELARYNPTGIWWRGAKAQILVLHFVATVVNSALGILVQLPFLIVQQFYIFREISAGQVADPNVMIAGTLWLQIPMQIASAFITAVSWLFWSVGICMLYLEIRRRKEGADLETAIDSLTAKRSPTTPSSSSSPAEVPA